MDMPSDSYVHGQQGPGPKHLILVFRPTQAVKWVKILAWTVLGGGIVLVRSGVQDVTAATNKGLNCTKPR